MDDYISRQAVLNLPQSITRNFMGEVVERSIDIEDVKTLPAADVVPVVHAHWIQTSAEDENGNAYYSCSNCGCGESHNPIVEVPYCWKCGAKMDRERKE